MRFSLGQLQVACVVIGFTLQACVFGGGEEPEPVSQICFDCDPPRTEALAEGPGAAALRAKGDVCDNDPDADPQCQDDLVCRPLTVSNGVESRCDEPGVEYISKRFGGAVHLCGDLCDTDADCAPGHSCVGVTETANGMCLADGPPILDMRYGEIVSDCDHRP